MSALPTAFDNLRSGSGGDLAARLGDPSFSFVGGDCSLLKRYRLIIGERYFART